MPVTKKKGAIFEIYADSPQPARRTSASSSSSNSNSLSGPNPSSPSKRPARKALASLPPRASQPASSAAKKPHPLGPSAARPALSAKPQNISAGPVLKPAKPASGAVSAKPAKMKIFVDEPSEKKSQPKEGKEKETARRRPLGTLSASTSRPTSSSRPLGLRSSASGPSSGRAFDIFVDPVEPSRKRERVSSPLDKENAAPDSPASRTRSKSRTALRSLDALDSSPSKPAKLAPKTKRRFEVQPLADVSAAYEATGAEPEGFRDQALRR